jgi:16S rRNA (guanine1516-N2)-methyltransferase
MAKYTVQNTNAVNPPTFAVSFSENTLQDRAKSLAKQLLLPLVSITEVCRFTFVLLLTEHGLHLQTPQNPEMNDLKVDFLTGEMGYRLRHLKNQTQLLTKAIKLTPLKTTVLDLTAGLGHDGYVLARLGYNVMLLERSPIVAALLRDGLGRAATVQPHTFITLIEEDAHNYLISIKEGGLKPNVIYIDPMYPTHHKKALVKKEMRILRQIVGADTDAETLLPLAIACAQQRVVVKRPRWADPLAKQAPHHCILGKQHRFDVYLNISE